MRKRHHACSCPLPSCRHLTVAVVAGTCRHIIGLNQRWGIDTWHVRRSSSFRGCSTYRRCNGRRAADVRCETCTVFYDCARVLAYYFLRRDDHWQRRYLFLVGVKRRNLTTGYLNAADNFLQFSRPLRPALSLADWSTLVFALISFFTPP